MNREQAVACAELAIRASWRMEIHPDELETAGRILVGLARRKEPPTPVLRLAAAGRELLSVRRLVVKTREMVRDGDLLLGSRDEEKALDETLEEIEGLVVKIEGYLGSFPKPDPVSRKSGVRETFLVEIDPEQHQSARWIVDVAHQASDAPEPGELVGRMMLRAIAAELRELHRDVSEASGELDEGSELREIAGSFSHDCSFVAGRIEAALPPVPAVAEAPGETKT